MRIVIAGINHETNTYCLEQTVASDFHQSRGERILRSLGTETSIGGALEACAELGIEALPLLMTLITGAVMAFPTQAEFYLLEPFRGDDYSLDFDCIGFCSSCISGPVA